MTKTEKNIYRATRPIKMIYDGCYDSLLVLDVIYEIDEYIVLMYKNVLHKVKVYYDLKNNAFIKLYGKRFYLNNAL